MEKNQTKKIKPAREMSWYKYIMSKSPEFATREEALRAYRKRLKDHAWDCGRTIKELLEKAEHSPEPDEEADKAMDLWRAISMLKRKFPQEKKITASLKSVNNKFRKALRNISK